MHFCSCLVCIWMADCWLSHIEDSQKMEKLIFYDLCYLINKGLQNLHVDTWSHDCNMLGLLVVFIYTQKRQLTFTFVACFHCPCQCWPWLEVNLLITVARYTTANLTWHSELWHPRGLETRLQLQFMCLLKSVPQFFCDWSMVQHISLNMNGWW